MKGREKRCGRVGGKRGDSEAEGKGGERGRRERREREGKIEIYVLCI